MGTAIALGNFDGVHKAHEKLVRKAIGYARENGLSALAYVFTPHPRRILSPASPSFLLTTDSRKTKKLLEIGLDRVIEEDRGMEILSLSPEQFVKDILLGELEAEYVTAGFNYRFGKAAAGDAALLRALCQREGIQCEIMEPLCADGKTISSTEIRALLAMGEVEKVNALSFAPYTIEGVVQEGKRLGHTLGFPTMNIELPGELLPPKRGVYVSRTRAGGKVYESVTNIGHNPTVEEAPLRAESHLLAFSGEAYGTAAEITLLKMLRPEKKFPDTDALMAQIAHDVAETKLYFERKDLHAADTD